MMDEVFKAGNVQPEVKSSNFKTRLGQLHKIIR